MDLIKDKKIHWSFYDKDEPFILHIIKTGFKNRYYYFYEDPYEMEPFYSGINYDTKENLESKFNIQLDD